MEHPRVPGARSVFDHALEIDSPALRRAYVAEACAGDEGLRQTVDALLMAYENAGSFLESPLSDVGAAATIDQPAPRLLEGAGSAVGPYKLLEQIGEGGFGVVFLAEQHHPMRRRVALKVLKPGMDTRQVVARFEAERQALAMMDHPSIAKVLDGGETAFGRPFFVMELVKGEPITRYCDEHRLTLRDRLALFVQVCRAVQHAHTKGIIHRDLKPSNVLVAQYDGKPVPKVIDFGVAKATGARLTEHTVFTGLGSVVGTPEYMSPEQAEMNQLDVDTRSDVYSLGVILYELLTGSTPVERRRFKEAALLEVLRVVREEEAPRPSTRLSTTDQLASIAACRGLEPKKLGGVVRGELDWIVMRALEKDRNRRYETANGFAKDVQRYLDDEAVHACPPSTAYRLKKFARRNRAGLAVAGLVLFFLVLLGGGIGWAARDRDARRARVATRVELIVADAERLTADRRWDEALGVARRAEAALAGGEADAAASQRARALLKDLEFIDRLEQARLRQATCVQGRRDQVGTDREYARAFREYGVDVEASSVETSVERLKARPAFVIPIAAALDDWVGARRSFMVDDAAWAPLVAVARGIDPDPLRDVIRSVWGRPASEVRDELGRLAESIDVRAQQPATIASLAHTLRRAGHPDFEVRVLRDAQFWYPGDFWLNLDLAAALNRQHDFAGALRYATAAVSIRPNASVAHNILGNVFGEQNKVDEGFACYSRAVELDPKFAIAYANLGEMLNRRNRPHDECVAAYRKALEIDPNCPPAHAGLGRVLLRQKKLDEASAEFRKAILADPFFPYAYCGLSDVFREQNKPDEALVACRKAIELDPKSGYAYHSLGNAMGLKKKLDDAIAAYRKAVELDPTESTYHSSLGAVLGERKHFDEAIAACRKGIELDPTDANGYAQLGRVLHLQQKLDEAVVAYLKSNELDPTSATNYNNLGAALRGQKKPDEAIAAYRRAIELDPKLAEPHSNVGNLFLEQRSLDQALAEFRLAIDLDPTNANNYVFVGKVLEAQDKGEEAIAAYRAGIKVDPNNAGTHHELATTLARYNRVEEATAAYRAAIQADPNYAVRHLMLGDHLYGVGKYDEAIAALQRAIELDPKCGPAFIVLGHTLLIRNKPEQALLAFQNAIEIGAKVCDVYVGLGLALAALKKPDEAIAAYRQALELDPNSVRAQFEIGQALRSQGKWAEAIVAFGKAIEIDPKSPWAHYELADSLVRSRQWDKAAAAYVTAMDVAEPINLPKWLDVACTVLKAGDVEAYRKVCARMATRFGKGQDPHQIAFLAHVCVLAPDALGDGERVLQLAEQRAALTREFAGHKLWSTHVLGLGFYRAGKFDKAVATVEADQNEPDLTSEVKMSNWLTLAMSRQRLGQRPEAAAAFQSAQAILTKEQRKLDEQNLIVQILYREAEALLGKE